MSMDSKDLIKAGRLSDARKQLTEEVKSSPGDFAKRTLLFQVLSYCGEWDKAERHLEAIGAQSLSAEVGVQVYRNLIHAEKERTDVSKLNRRPSFLPKTPSYAEMYFTAWEKLTETKFEEAENLFSQIETQRPIISGTVDGKNFSGFRDTDTFLSLFLEAIAYEQYVWIPFESIRELSISTPKTLFDLLWISSRVTTWEGLTLSCYLPVLYPDSSSHEDDRVKLGKMTDWIPMGGPYSKGMGQHVFEMGDEEVALLEIREVVFNRLD
jgi:type VI secretion system protein ImpE